MAAARRHGLKLVQERPQSLDGLLRDGDYVVTVCDAAHETTCGDDREAPVRLAGMSHWSVPDPVAAGTDAAFDAAYDDIAGRVADLAPLLTPQQQQPGAWLPPAIGAMAEPSVPSATSSDAAC